METLEFFAQYILSPMLIIIIGKYIDSKTEKYRKKRMEEKAAELAKEQEIAAKIELISAELKLLRTGLLAMQRDKLIQSCSHFIDQGHIPLIVLANLTKLHDAYKDLGGNGLCDQLFKEVQELTIIKKEGE